MAYAIKAEIPDTREETFVFAAQKTMYGGKRIAAGDTIFLFASENEGGHGLVARGIVQALFEFGARGIVQPFGIDHRAGRAIRAQSHHLKPGACHVAQCCLKSCRIAHACPFQCYACRVIAGRSVAKDFWLADLFLSRGRPYSRAHGQR